MDILKRNHVRYGLIMSAVVVVCLFLMEITGGSLSEKSPFLVFSTMIAPIFVWFFGLQARKKELKNKLSVHEGVKESFKISLIFAIVSPVIFLLYYLLFNMSAVEYARTAYGLTDASDTIVIAVDMLVQFVAAILFGTLYGAILTPFLRTKKSK